MKILLRWAGALALALMPSAALAQAKVANLPVRVGATALAIGDQDATATTVSATNPLPTSDASASPCRRWTAVTPSDTVDLAEVPKALYVGGGGDLVLIGVDALAGAAGVTWKAVPAASMLPARARRVMATGTTATSIVACF